MPSGDVPKVSRGLLKGQTIEQHFDEADGFEERGAFRVGK